MNNFDRGIERFPRLPREDQNQLVPAGGNVVYPFVTAKQPRWVGARNDVNGTGPGGQPVPPSNYYNTDPLETTTPFSLLQAPADFVVVPPTVSDPTQIINETGCIYLVPGATYYWGGVVITRPVCVYGRGATIKLKGEGPIFEVTGGEGIRSVDIPSIFRDIVFDGDVVVNRNSVMSNEFVRHSAIWITNAWRSSVMNCTFMNFNGTALWYRDDKLYVSNPGSRFWLQQHLVIGNRFQLCRFGVSNSGRSEYSLADSNVFGDCCVAFNCIGGNWSQRGNNMTATKCGYFHVRRLMWYEGTNRDNPVHGAFTGNTLNHCDNGCKWPFSLMLPNNVQITSLSGLYFDNVTITPPTFNDNTMWYSGIELRGFGLISNIKSYVITGLTFVGPSANPKSRIAVTTTGSVNNSTYLIGCWGNNQVTIYNIPQANITPATGLNITTGTYTTEFPNARAGEADYFGMYPQMEWFETDEDQPLRPDGDDLPTLPPECEDDQHVMETNELRNDDRL